MFTNNGALIYDALDNSIIEIFDYSYNYNLKTLFFVYYSQYTDDLAFMGSDYLNEYCVILEYPWEMEEEEYES